MPEVVAHDRPAGDEVAVSAGDAPRRRRVAPLVALAVAVVLGALFVVLARSDTTRSDEVTSFAVGKPAPRMVASTLDGKPFDLSRRKGSWVVLNFFNTTCGPCRAEHPELVKFFQQQQSLGLAGAELYTVTWGQDRESDVTDWFATHGGGWPVVKDDNGKIAVSLGVAQVPETWIVDPQGVIVARIPTQITADASVAAAAAVPRPGVRSGVDCLSWQRQLKRWPGWVLLVLVVAGFLAVGATRDSGPRTPDERLEDISSRLACPICAGESVFESRNSDSEAIRTEIRAQDRAEQPHRHPDHHLHRRPLRGAGAARAEGVRARRAGVGVAGGRADLRARRARLRVPALAAHRRHGPRRRGPGARRRGVGPGRGGRARWRRGRGGDGR